MSRTERASGVAAILRQEVRQLDQVTLRRDDFWTAMSHIRSPGNLGTLMRTSAAVGARGFILLGNSIDPFDPAVARATMGAMFRQTLVRTSIEKLVRWVSDHNVHVVGASPDGADDYRQLSYERPSVLMLGGERKGLTDEQRSVCDRIVRIPMIEGTDSLNVAIAGSLLLYEAFRSRSVEQILVPRER